jgi:hypothetical protein
VTSEALERVAPVSCENFHPWHIIRAVNSLQPLGKAEAIAQIDEYLAGHHMTNSRGLFWVLRVLFDMPGSMPFPPVRIGQPTIPPPRDPLTLPRFPIVIVRDVPLLVVRGYALGGLPESVREHVAFFSAHGEIRGGPLTPPASAGGIADELLGRWNAAYHGQYSAELLAAVEPQLARFGAG